MNNFSMVHEKMTVTGPRSEIDSLVVYLENEVPNICVVKSFPHFPRKDSITDLYLVVCREKLEDAAEKICSRSNSCSLYRGG